MKILHLDNSILGELSISRSISAQVVEKLKATHGDAQVTYRDLVADPLPHITGELAAAMRGLIPEPRPEVQEQLVLADTLVDEFLSADIAVIGAALYNLTVSTHLKAWMDRVLRAGKTFRYNESGEPVGLAGDARVILCISRGGVYAPGTPGAAIEHCESYLRDVLNFMGVKRLDVIAADGSAIGPEFAERAKVHVAKAISLLDLA